jgi:hypothetical protein
MERPLFPCDEILVRPAGRRNRMGLCGWGGAEERGGLGTSRLMHAAAAI